VRQPLESFTVTPPTHKQETSKNAPFVDRSDPNSPLCSLKSFEELKLKPNLLKGQSILVENKNCQYSSCSYFTGMYNMGFRSPSKIQADALPHLLGNPPSKLNLFLIFNDLSNLLH
jgi:ATP-dependent RNA helicase DDX19/DBP5